MLGIICRSFQHLTPIAFCMLYVSMVRPHLDYVCFCSLEPTSSEGYKSIGGCSTTCHQNDSTIWHNDIYWEA